MKHRKMSEQMEKDIQEIVDFYMQFVTGEYHSIRESLEYFWKCMNDYTIEDYLQTVREQKARMKAFPQRVSNEYQVEHGMDLRDYFASQIIAGFLANNKTDYYRNSGELMVKLAYEMADLMMKEREK